MADQLDTNVLYYGDNLEVLRKYIPDSSVDLVYLDPPFNSNRTYNVLYRESDIQESEAQIEAFLDTWHWNTNVENSFDEFRTTAPEPQARLLEALVSGLGRNDVTAYLVMMAPRLAELNRVLKPTGHLFLHCDPSAGHYLKVVADSVMGARNFRSEIVWRRSNSHNKISRQLGPIHDTILFYAKSEAARLRSVARPHYRKYIAENFRQSDARGPYRFNEITGTGTRNGESGRPWRDIDITALGRHWAVPGSLVSDLGLDPDDPALQSQHSKLDAIAAVGEIEFSSSGFPRYKQRPTAGVPFQDIWAYQPYTEGLLHGTGDAVDRDVKWLEDEEERLGYPTQKPRGLLERIILLGTSEGDVVLDPFCGCGTAMDAAQGLKRRWIGIDITHLAIGLIRRRLVDRYSELAGSIHVVGEPTDNAGALELAAQDKYQFQWWAVDRLNAQPVAGEKRKGKDRGIDGVFAFIDGPNRSRMRVIISVKGGATGPNDVRDLAGVLSREKDAPLGILVTANTRTAEMEKEAASAGIWESDATGQRLPVIQILTAEDVLHGRYSLPRLAPSPFRRARRARASEGSQIVLPDDT